MRRHGRLSRQRWLRGHGLGWHRLRWHGLGRCLRVGRIGGLRVGLPLWRRARIRSTRKGRRRVARWRLLRVPRLLRLRVTLRLRLRVALGLLRRVARLLRLGIARLLRLGVTLLRLWWGLRRISRLLRLGIPLLRRVAAGTPGRSRRRGLPGGRCDRALLTGRDVRRRGPLQRALAASQQVLQASLVDIEVARQVGIGPWPEHALAALEFPEQVEGLPRAADPAAARVRQGAGLEGVHPVPLRLVQLEHTRLGTIDHLVEEAKHAGTIDGAERGRCGLLGALLHLALGEELHTAVTGGGRLSLPV